MRSMNTRTFVRYGLLGGGLWLVITLIIFVSVLGNFAFCGTNSECFSVSHEVKKTIGFLLYPATAVIESLHDRHVITMQNPELRGICINNLEQCGTPASIFVLGMFGNIVLWFIFGGLILSIFHTIKVKQKLH